MRMISRHKKTVTVLVMLLVGVFIWTVMAGDLNPPGVPAGTMRTLNEIYAVAFEPVSVPLNEGVTFTGDYFLFITDIPGESRDSNHIGWIEPVGYTLHIENGADVKGDPNPKFSNLLVAKMIDCASIPLMLKCCNNTHIPQVIIERARAGGEKDVFYRLTLTGSRVTYISPTSARTPLYEVVSFGDFEKIKLEYRTVDPITGQPGPWQTEEWDIEKHGGES